MFSDIESFIVYLIRILFYKARMVQGLNNKCSQNLFYNKFYTLNLLCDTVVEINNLSISAIFSY